MAAATPDRPVCATRYPSRARPDRRVTSVEPASNEATDVSTYGDRADLGDHRFLCGRLTGVGWLPLRVLCRWSGWHVDVNVEVELTWSGTLTKSVLSIVLQ